MAKTHRLEVTEKSNYHVVRVIENFDDFGVDTFSDLHDEFGRQIIPQIVKWCEDNACGIRTSYDQFKFRDRDQLTMFILRWS